jgi:hypothetical protein
VILIYSVLVVELCQITYSTRAIRGDLDSQIPHSELIKSMSNKTLFDNVIGIHTIGSISVLNREHVFEQRLNFDRVYDELFNMRLFIDNMNPDELHEFHHMVIAVILRLRKLFLVILWDL